MPLRLTILLTTKKLSNIDNNNKKRFCWKYLDHSLNNCEGWTQWVFVPLRETLVYTTSNLKRLRKFLEANQFIDCNRSNEKTDTLAITFHKPVGEANPYVRFGILPTDNLLSHPSISFMIIVHLSNKHYTHKSTMNKIFLEKEL